MQSPHSGHLDLSGRPAASISRLNGPDYRQHIRIYYLCPDTHLASAGIRRLYRHVAILHQAGFNARILHYKNGFRCADSVQVPIDYLDRICLETNTVTVVPEGCPAIMQELKDQPGRRFAIALNWDYIFKDLPEGINWRNFNIERVLAVSPVIAEMVRWSMELPTHVLHSCLNRELYYVDVKTKRPQIAFIARKATHVQLLKRILSARNPDLGKPI